MQHIDIGNTLFLIGVLAAMITVIVGSVWYARRLVRADRFARWDALLLETQQDMPWPPRRLDG